MPKLLHAADLHIDSPLKGLDAYDDAPVEKIRTASRGALDNLVSLAIEERVAGVVIAGDVYDTKPLLSSALYFRAAMQRLSDAKIPVAIVRGNHDHEGVAPKNLALPDSVHVFSHEDAEAVPLTDGVVVHGRSYYRRDVTEPDFVERYGRPHPGVLNVGLLHTALEGESEHAPYAPTSRRDLWAKGYQYWALGHVHRRQEWREGGVPIVFPGNLQGRHVRETGAKGATLVEYEGDRVTRVVPVSLDVVRWHHVVLDAQQAPPDGAHTWVRDRVLAATAEDRGSQRLCAVRVALKGVASGSARGVTAESLREYLLGEMQAAGDALWLEKVLVQTRGAHEDATELEEQLRVLLQERGSAAIRADLAQELGKLRATLRKAEPALLDELGLKDAAVTLGEDEAAVLLEEALQELLAQLV